jgi:hypothetical protein
MNIGQRQITLRGLLFKAANALDQRQRRSVARKVIAANGLTIRSGPFAGMQYLRDSHGSELPPKLIGSYEVELAPVLERWLARRFKTVVDVGCAEGYYAVGLARRLPTAQVYACDINQDAQRLCRRLALLNSVADRVNVGGECTAAELQKILIGASLVLSDCEGAELDVLQPAIAPALRSAYIIVELHDFIVPGASRELSKRFGSSHDISFITSTTRKTNDWPLIGMLNDAERSVAIDERRLPQEWMILAPRT